MFRLVLMENGALFILYFAVLGVTTPVGWAQTDAVEKEDSPMVHVLAPPGLHDDTYPPDPDNAALLYYQAMLVQPLPDGDTVGRIYKTLRADGLNERIREYLQLPDCRRAIMLAEMATEIPECSWGIPYSVGISLYDDALHNLCLLLEANVRSLAADGKYREALARCLMLRRLARHIQSVSLIAGNVDLKALGRIRDVLGSMRPDANTLSWLQGQLLVKQGARISAAERLTNDFESVLRLVRDSPLTLAAVRKELIENAMDDSAKKEIQSLTDEQLLARARQSYEKFLNTVLRVIGSGMSYEKTYAELEKLMEQLEEQADRDPVTILRHCGSQVGRYYDSQTSHIAEVNILRAAIEVYLALANTGRLPETLPGYAPEDPYSGGDFEYEKTGLGFIIRSPVRRASRNPKGLEFKVHR